MEILTKTLVLFGFVIILAFVLALPTMWLWNWLIPPIFGLIKITFWQALGINLLTGLLFRTSNSSPKSK